MVSLISTTYNDSYNVSERSILEDVYLRYTLQLKGSLGRVSCAFFNIVRLIKLLFESMSRNNCYQLITTHYNTVPTNLVHGRFFGDDFAIAFEPAFLLAECAFQHSISGQDLRLHS